MQYIGIIFNFIYFIYESELSKVENSLVKRMKAKVTSKQMPVLSTIIHLSSNELIQKIFSSYPAYKIQRKRDKFKTALTVSNPRLLLQKREWAF